MMNFTLLDNAVDSLKSTYNSLEKLKELVRGVEHHVKDAILSLNHVMDDFELPGKGIFEVEFYVGSYVDGDNNKAEIYFKKLNMTSIDVYVRFYD